MGKRLGVLLIDLDRTVVQGGDQPLEPGFYISLSPIAGAVEAIKQLKIEGWEIFFCGSCSAPLIATEKYKWIEIHFGKEWIDRLILTHDTTLIRGDYFIGGNRCSSSGIGKPSWYHIPFEHKLWLDQTKLKSLLIPL